MPASPSPLNPHKAAKQLIKLIKAGDPAAIQRARAVYHDLDGVPNAEVPDKVGLQRCQHIISTEYGAKNWVGLTSANTESKPCQVVGTLGTDDFEALRKLAEQEPAGSLVRRMMANMINGAAGYRARGTRKECDEMIAWSLRVHPPSARTKTKLGEALRIEPLSRDDDDGPDSLHYINDLDAPGEL